MYRVLSDRNKNLEDQHFKQQLIHPRIVERVTRAEIAGVVNSFKEMHDFLCYELSYFVPSRQHCTGEWLSMIWSGKKKVLRRKDVDCQSLPHVKGLRIEQIFAFIKAQGSEDYPPPPSKRGKPIKYSRDWLVKVSGQLDIPDEV